MTVVSKRRPYMLLLDRPHFLVAFDGRLFSAAIIGWRIRRYAFHTRSPVYYMSSVEYGAAADGVKSIVRKRPTGVSLRQEAQALRGHVHVAQCAISGAGMTFMLCPACNARRALRS
jgi:hypothetical protein